MKRENLLYLWVPAAVRALLWDGLGTSRTGWVVMGSLHRSQSPTVHVTPRLQGPACPHGRHRARKEHQLRALWLLTGFISEVVSYDLGMTVQTPHNPLGKSGLASVTAFLFNPNRTQKRWARGAGNSRGGGSLGCMGVFDAALPFSSGASVWTGCFCRAGGTPWVIAAVSGKFL